MIKMDGVTTKSSFVPDFSAINNKVLHTQDRKSDDKFIKNLPNPAFQFNSKKVSFNAASLTLPPPLRSRFIVEENEKSNCSPRFMKPSLWAIPETSTIIEQCKVPLLVIISPFAEVLPNEYDVPSADFRSNGPIRCRLCGAYINPFVNWIHGGRSYTCSLCRTQNEVPDWYFYPIGNDNRRMDVDKRPELWKGSVDFLVSPDFYYKQINFPYSQKILFVIETTYLNSSKELGLVKLFCNSLSQILENCFEGNDNTQFGFITFNRTINFWRLYPRISMVSISVSREIFCPIPVDSMFVNYHEGKEVIQAILRNLEEVEEFEEVDNCFGAALNCAMLALGRNGGKIVTFLSSLPSVGPGKLKNYDSRETKNLRDLYLPTTNYYKKLATECSEKGICVDLFAYTNQYLNLASIIPIIKYTGGQLYYIYNFKIHLHEENFFFDLYRNLIRMTGFFAIGKLRCSDGICVDRYEGNFSINDGDLEFPAIDSDKSITAYLKVDSNLNGDTLPCIQWAILYLNSDGQCYIRVHTMTFNVVSDLSSLYKYCDCEVIMNHFLRLAATSYSSLELLSIKTLITKKVIDIFASYRANCSKGRSSAQLILPETIKLLPCYIYGAIKSTLLTDHHTLFPLPISVDRRIFMSEMIISGQLEVLSCMFYPKIYNMNELYNLLKNNEKKSVLPGDLDYCGLYWLPSTIRALSSEIHEGGIYLMDNGEMLSMAFVQPIDQRIFYELVNPSTGVSEENPHSEFNIRTFNIIKSIRYQRSYYQPLIIFNYSLDSMEKLYFQNNLVEDESPLLSSDDLASKSYYKYLCYIHEYIMNSV